MSITQHRRPMVFREVNEQIERMEEGWGISWPVSLLCECGNSGCVERIEITPADYEEVRRFPTHFLVKRGHVDHDGERVICQSGQYVVVEKTGRAATEAIRLDPRRIEGALR